MEEHFFGWRFGVVFACQLIADLGEVGTGFGRQEDAFGHESVFEGVLGGQDFAAFDDGSAGFGSVQA